MEFLYYPLGFVLLLGIVVTIHEFGHFIVARWSGVHVLRFSVGFGKPLLTRTDTRGTDFTLALIPLGGYVRMLDDRDPEQAELLDEMKLDDPSVVSYMDLTPWWRIAIALAGPIANFVLAFVIFWLVAVIGEPQPVPLFGPAAPETPLARAGFDAPAEIVAIDGKTTPEYRDVALALGDRLGDTGSIEFRVKELESAREKILEVPIRDWHSGEVEPDFFTSLGFQRSDIAIIGQVVDGSAAARAGFESGDFVVAAANSPIETWTEWDRTIKDHPNQALVVEVSRAGRRVELQAVPDGRVNADGVQEGFLGVSALLTREVSHGIVRGAVEGLVDTGDKTMMTLGFLKKMIFGQVSVRNLVGPVGIAQIAGDTVRSGWMQFAFIMALMSISVGIMNLLPIPLLDGGHVMFNAVELVIGRPVPERVQIVGVQIGMAIVGGMLILATYNDILRIF